MITEEDKDALIEAVNDVIFKKYLPLIFTQEQIDEMGNPYHSIYDHLNAAHIYSLDDQLEEFGYLKPQLQISDPRIDEAIIDSLPKTIEVPFQGQVFTMPVRIFTSSFYQDVPTWKSHMEDVYKVREIIEDLEPGLTKEFNLASGTDYDFGFGQGMKGKLLSFQALNDKAKPHAQDILAYIQEKLDQRDDHDIVQLRFMGPIVLHAN